MPELLWRQWSDALLRRRLILSGCPTENAIALVARRWDPSAAQVIERWVQ